LDEERLRGVYGASLRRLVSIGQRFRLEYLRTTRSRIGCRTVMTDQVDGNESLCAGRYLRIIRAALCGELSYLSIVTGYEYNGHVTVV
jgi:hypothetical protein